MNRVHKITSLILILGLLIGILTTGVQAVTFESEIHVGGYPGELYEISNEYKVVQANVILQYNAETGEWESPTIEVFEVPVGTTITLLDREDMEKAYLWITDIQSEVIWELDVTDKCLGGSQTFTIEDSNNYYHISTGFSNHLTKGLSGEIRPVFELDKGFWVKGVETVSSNNTDEKVTVTASPTASKVFVNGKETSFDSYTINQNNYFKIRDIAFALNRTDKQFEVIWDNSKNAISMTSNHGYSVVGGEVALGDGADKTATLNTAKVYLDGKEISLTAYTINGNNYVKLRDLGQLFNFGVSWNGAVVIDTSAGYEEDTPANSASSQSQQEPLSEEERTAQQVQEQLERDHQQMTEADRQRAEEQGHDPNKDIYDDIEGRDGYEVTEDGGIRAPEA